MTLPIVERLRRLDAFLDANNRKVTNEAADTIEELVEALNSIAEHKTSHPCASAYEEDRRTLVEVQDIARQYAMRVTKLNGAS
jgi:histone H3/H4